MKDLTKFLVGTTVPTLTDDASIPCFGRSEENFKLMRDAGVKIVRIFSSFPFTDESMTEESAAYKQFKADVKLYADNGIETMGALQLPGQFRSDGEGKVSYIRHYPDWMGPLTEDKYYDILAKVAEYVAKDTKDSIIWWQIANEPDIDMFIGDMTFEQNSRWLDVAAHAVKKGNPDAKCGINLAGAAVCGAALDENGNKIPGKPHIHPYAKDLLVTLYQCKDTAFDFIGLDGYFGSWSFGDTSDWTEYIDSAYEITGKPVIIAEWGYSTLQKGEPRPEEDKHRYFNSATCREKDMDAAGFRWLGKEHSEWLQPEYIMECIKIFAENEHCIGHLFFQWQDQANCWQCGEPDCPAECSWGCLHADGSPKPGYYGLVAANKKYFG